MSRRTAVNDEFVTWDELDLTGFLDDFPDFSDETMTCASGSDDEDTSVRRKSRSKSTTTAKSREVTYLCPEPDCKRVYNSVTGFRKHVSNKHGLQNVKAANNKTGNFDQPALGLPSSQADPVWEEISSEFLELIGMALTTIKTDEQNNNENSRHGNRLIETASLMENSRQEFLFLKEHFLGIFPKEGSISRAGEREDLMRRFHELTMQQSVWETFVYVMNTDLDFHLEKSHLRIFWRVFLEELLNATLKTLADKHRRETVRAKGELSSSDKDVLEYIGGYCVNKLLHRKGVSPSEKDILLSFVHEKENVTPKSWTNKIDRGGLKHTNLQNLFVTAETIVRQSVDMSRIRADSLCQTVLLEKVMEADRVKRAWSLVVPGFCEHVLLCEKLLILFLRVRGFATAKLIKNASTGLGKKSLRKSLKKPSLSNITTCSSLN